MNAPYFAPRNEAYTQSIIRISTHSLAPPYTAAMFNISGLVYVTLVYGRATSQSRASA